MAATLDDIAQELGISKGTVSKALNGAKDVSRRMQRSVLEKAVELGYSRLNRNTAAPRVAIFITNMDWAKPEDFGYDMVMGFRQVAEPAGYHVSIVPLDTEMQRSMRYDEYMMMENYCGSLVLGMSLLDPWIREFETCKTPTVLYDNHISGNPKVTHIGVDSLEGIQLAFDHLRSLGHEKIGYLSGALEAYVFQQRHQSFCQVMTRMGLTPDESSMGSAYHINVCLSLHLPRLLKNGCTAIICSHDNLARSVMEHCTQLGMQIPRDISILGYDDLPVSSTTQPPLTTIRQNRLALGKCAFYALLSQLDGVPVSTHLLHAELIQRSSCGPVAKADPAVPSAE